MVAFSYLYVNGRGQIAASKHGKSNSSVETIRNEIIYP